MKGIPTIYRGRQYRSRLEAKWAAFFHLVEWEVEYEPFDLDGWIPDFVIQGRGRNEFPPDASEEHRNQILIEVKPILELPIELSNRLEVSCPIGAEILVCGCSLLTPEYPLNWVKRKEILGWLFDGDQWSPAPLGFWSAGKGRLGFCHENGSFRDRISGGYDGGCFGDLTTDEMMEWAIAQWDSASNDVQWKSSRRRRLSRGARYGFSHGKETAP